jgi:stage II sporulation protein P
MISVGAHLARLLEAGGIRVIQDTAIHDAYSYSQAYFNSRKSMEDYLKEYPSIRLVLDLHRDAIEDAGGNQIAQTVFSNGTVLAPLMLVVGTNYGGYIHPEWRENLALALKLQTQLEGICPGICRDISLRSDRFNQDLSTGALLVEVGASGNTREQALRAVEMLAQGILSLAHGSQ